MYNIFQIIALYKAIQVCSKFSYCFSPFHYSINWNLGMEMVDSKTHMLGKYGFLGQKIVYAAILKLQETGMVANILNSEFLGEELICDSSEPIIEVTSAPPLGYELKGTDKLIRQLFFASWLDI